MNFDIELTPTPKREPNDQPLDDRLHDILYKYLGGDWRKDLKLTVRADVLYWVVNLAVQGIEARRQKFKEDIKAGNAKPVEAAASLGSWHLDLKALVDQVETVLDKKSK